MRYRYRSKDELKDSGVEWIGKIPKDWKVGKFKYSSLLYTGNSIKDNEKDNYTDPENSYPYISTKDINIDYNTINYNNGMYTKTNDKTFKIANKDSILICIEGGSAGRKISYLNQNVSFVNKLCCIQSNKIDSKYQYYYCNSDAFKKEFSLNMSGLIGGVSVSALNNFRLVNPSLFEQEKISNFLDEKTSQFDLIISKKEKLIERLEESKKSLISEVVTGKMKVVKTDDGYGLIKRSSEEMKDSGVEYIGYIPKHWKLSRIKNFTTLKSIKNKQNLELLSLYRDYGVVPKNSRDDNNNRPSEDLSGYKYVQINDLVLNKMKVWQGSLAVSEYEGIVSPAYIICGIDSKIMQPRYAHYLLRNKLYIPEYRRLSTGIRPDQWDISYDNFKNISALIPSIEEQNNIVEYLDNKLIGIDNLVIKIKQQIEKLKEAKQSLISEAVTGKIEILD